MRYDRIGKKGAFELDNAMMEVGVDSLHRKETGEFHTGVAFDYMKGDADYLGVKGDGNVDRYGAWWFSSSVISQTTSPSMRRPRAKR